MTNGDKIRTMPRDFDCSDFCNDFCEGCLGNCRHNMGKEFLIKWLESEIQ